MATLLLTAVGTALGGPIGAAVGAVLGQAADQTLFGPKARPGPRLGNLTVQTSSYGTDIPRVFGSMRVAGTVIWATDIVETRSSSGGGKGRPRSVGYAYSANFAVALSARKLRAVHRIWADGKLLRGAAGDFKTATIFRFHDGDEDQPVDPLIASAEGPGLAPSYRGLAYAVFEGLQLADFGNRIPSLSFEVEADPGGVSIGRIAEELSGGILVAGETPSVDGYAASGDSARGAISALLEAVPLPLRAQGDRLVLGPDGADATLVPLAARIGRLELMRRAAAPTCVTLSYYDVEREYQAGTQRASRPGAPGRTLAIPLAAALAPGPAKEMAEARLAADAAARASAGVRLGWRHLGLVPGARARLEGEAGLWTVQRWRLGPAIADIELARLPDVSAPPATATPGRTVRQPDLVHGPTSLHIFEAPLPGYRDGPWLFVAAAGASSGWREATLLRSSDGGVSWDESGRTAEPAVLGQSLTALPAAPAALIDLRSSVVVELLNDAMEIESRTDAALGGGANLALLGSELVQFGAAERIGERRYRLSRLLRGRSGSEWAAADHVAGEAFVLIEPATILPLQLPLGAIGATAVVTAAGLGDPVEGVRAERPITGEAVMPVMPVHLAAVIDAAGDLVVTWVRRSRSGFEWSNGSDVPLGEEQERYRVSIVAAAATRRFEVAEPQLVYTGAERVADGIVPPFAIAVAQVGTHATSRPAILPFG
ncbi:MAG TPA: phage tail protein [Allosphingosinicella sp.]|nr:phage tail protein [Allosphingosinicella sp.]